MGHLFQGRFKSILGEKEHHLLALFRTGLWGDYHRTSELDEAATEACRHAQKEAMSHRKTAEGEEGSGAV